MSDCTAVLYFWCADLQTQNRVSQFRVEATLFKSNNHNLINKVTWISNIVYVFALNKDEAVSLKVSQHRISDASCQQLIIAASCHDRQKSLKLFLQILQGSLIKGFNPLIRKSPWLTLCNKQKVCLQLGHTVDVPVCVFVHICLARHDQIKTCYPPEASCWDFFAARKCQSCTHGIKIHLHTYAHAQAHPRTRISTSATSPAPLLTTVKLIKNFRGCLLQNHLDTAAGPWIN